MSDKYLKSLTFPGLADRYVVGDSSLSVSGAAADAKTTGDALATKAEVDGAYEAMTVGNAEQLVSNIRVTDTDPYLFRTAGGSLEIGDREYPTLVGGSVVVNQLVQNGNFPDGSTYAPTRGSFAVSNNIGTYTVTEVGNFLGANRFTFLTPLKPHKYLFTIDAYSTKAYTCAMKIANNSVIQTSSNSTVLTPNAWTAVNAIVSSELTIDTPDAGSCVWVCMLGSNNAGVGDEVKYKNGMVIDLTAMFGSTIADYIYTLEQGTAGAGVAFCKKYGIGVGYTAYNAGTLQSTTPTKHTTVGFNQWDEEVAHGYFGSDGGWTDDANIVASKYPIPVLPNTEYYLYCGTNSSVYIEYFDELVPSGQSAIEHFIAPRYNEANSTFITPPNCHAIHFNCGSAYGGTYKNDICINLHWDGERDGEYEPYTKHEYDLGNDTLRGVFELNNGELKANGDVKSADGTITRKFKLSEDLGARNWAVYGGGYPNLFYTNDFIGQAKPQGLLVCSANYTFCQNGSHVGESGHTHDIGFNFDGRLYINDTAYSDAAAFKAAMSGVYIVYELATPTEEEGTAFQSPQIVSNWGTEEYTEANGIVVGHSTEYPQDLKAKVESAPNNPSADGDYIVKRENGENAYVPLVIPTELPTNPSTDGTYVLKATVSSGSTVLSWEAEE